MAACFRWAVNIRNWEPSHSEWTFLLRLIPQEERQDVERFMQRADQKRALVSRLMQRRAASRALGIPFEAVTIKRTKGRKPFVSNSVDRSSTPNFNFNVSHEGDFVVLASEPLCICGIDVAAPEQVRLRGKEQGLEELQRIFRSQFTDWEWGCIRSAANEEGHKRLFRRHWSLKEAFVKARGDGIAFELNQAEFHIEGGGLGDSATVHVDGRPLNGWSFQLHDLPDGHIVSVARGSPADIIDAYQEFTETLQRRTLTPEEHEAALQAPAPAFSTLLVDDLVPEEKLDEYNAAADDA
mmetsp:Transcript_47803/g.120659  ORF Transcript_47803/g.120659 Transcript_47803/m.120659 type:complete len:296 (+) Transcript_47803:194-1081(+)